MSPAPSSPIPARPAADPKSKEHFQNLGGRPQAQPTGQAAERQCLAQISHRHQ
ncbi:hypothetical protein [Deinococcus rubellus]|uniref:hypothetical protein n=1 Tax=Deinococcus rubellus TaxID=1889240 RepID=UPI0031EFCF89